MKPLNTAATWLRVRKRRGHPLGRPEGRERLLLAGYYHQALADRKQGRAEAAADLIAAAARDSVRLEVQLLAPNRCCSTARMLERARRVDARRGAWAPAVSCACSGPCFQADAYRR
jgi:hypothetical protein